MKLAVIPARGGSKRIPRKNTKNFCGKPIIAWSIEAALESESFDKVIVSTDDEEIADLANKYGAEIPFMRPGKLSDDQAGTIPVIAHAINHFINRSETPDQVCCIYATAPFLTGNTLREGYEILVKRDCDYVFPVASYPFPIQRAIRIIPTGGVEMFYPEHFYTRSQDLEESYHDAGQFCWGKSHAWLEQRKVYGPNSSVIVLPRYQVQDIDTLEDWHQAELLFEVMKYNIRS